MRRNEEGYFSRKRIASLSLDNDLYLEVFMYFDDDDSDAKRDWILTVFYKFPSLDF